MGQLTHLLAEHGSLDFSIPQGSKITDVIVQFVTAQMASQYYVVEFFFGHGAYAAASIVPATHRLYIQGQIAAGYAASGTSNLAFCWPNQMVMTGLNITSVDNQAFIYLDVTQKSAALTNYVFVIITWDDSTPARTDFKNRPGGVQRGVQGINLSP